MNEELRNIQKKTIIEMLNQVKKGLEVVELKSEGMLIDEIIGNIIDSMIDENNNFSNLKNIDSINGDSIIIKNNQGTINNASGNSSINVKQTINGSKYNITGGNIGSIGDRGIINNANGESSINVEQTINFKKKFKF